MRPRDALTFVAESVKYWELETSYTNPHLDPNRYVQEFRVPYKDT